MEFTFSLYKIFIICVLLSELETFPDILVWFVGLYRYIPVIRTALFPIT